MMTLVFNNADATPKSAVIRCDAASVAQVMAWYGAYFAGDRYTVTLDGRNVPIDQNGEPITPPDGQQPGGVVAQGGEG